MADHAVHIYRGATHPAEEMVVVVSHTRFVQRWRSRGLDPAQHVCVDERVQVVVNGLTGKGRMGSARRADNALGI